MAQGETDFPVDCADACADNMRMQKTLAADRAKRGGVHAVYLPEPLRSRLLALKAKHGFSWSKLLEALLAKGGKSL